MSQFKLMLLIIVHFQFDGIADGILGHIGCDDIGTIYVNGHWVAETVNWQMTWSGNISNNATLLAITCRNTGGNYGIIGSFDNGVVTNRYWRCSDSFYTGWEKLNFDDSKWSRATMQGLNDGSYKSQDDLFHKDAQWIWTKTESYHLDKTVYCRGQIGYASAMFVNEGGTLYVNGKYIHSSTSASSLLTVQKLPPVLVGVHVTCHESKIEFAQVSVVASAAMTRDATWECTTKQRHGWMKMGYDAVTYGDRWFSAEITEKYTRTKHGKNRLGEQAYTIWSQGHFNNLNAKTNYYFCRGVFGIHTRLRVDSYGVLYLDGEPVGVIESADYLWVHVLPRTTRILAVKVEKDDRKGGMIAKFKNMDVTWRCSSEEVPNWMSVSFDDRSWAIASYVDHAIHSPVRFPAEKWMWIEGSDTMFCRAHIECGCSHKCDVLPDASSFTCSCPFGMTLSSDQKTCFVSKQMPTIVLVAADNMAFGVDGYSAIISIMCFLLLISFAIIIVMRYKMHTTHGSACRPVPISTCCVLVKSRCPCRGIAYGLQPEEPIYDIPSK